MILRLCLSYWPFPAAFRMFHSTEMLLDEFNIMAYEAAVADLGILKGNLHTLYYDGHQLGLKVGNT